MSLDVIIPPLTLLVAATLAMVFVDALIAFFGLATLPLSIAAANVLLLFIAVGIGWITHGRTILPLRSIAQVPVYAASKLKVYPKALLAGGNGAWIRTDRTGRD
jgi:hypothetical protein